MKTYSTMDELLHAVRAAKTQLEADEAVRAAEGALADAVLALSAASALAGAGELRPFLPSDVLDDVEAKVALRLVDIEAKVALRLAERRGAMP